MWFGTQGGLNRYDGYSFVVYKNQVSNSNSISDNTVNSVFVDHEGCLWLGTPSGLNRMDKKRGTFQRFTAKKSGNSISSDEVYAITEDDNNNIWIATYGGGLNKFNLKTKTFEVFFHKSSDEAAGRSNIMSLFFDKKEKVLWVGTLGGGLLRFDPSKNTFKQFIAGPGDQNISENVIYSLFIDNYDNLWLGTQNGSINKYDKQQHKFTKFAPETISKDPNITQQVWSISQEKNGTIWAATSGGGVKYLVPGTKSFVSIRNDPKDPYSLSTNQVSYLYVDNNDGLWVGTNGISLDYYNKHKSIFQHYQKKPFDKTSLSDNSVWSICENDEGKLFVGTNEGLNVLDAKKNREALYSTNSKGALKLNNNVINALCAVSNDELWAGTQAGGINIISFSTKKISYLLNDPKNAKSLPSNYIKAIYRDSRGLIWVGTDRGLATYNPSSGMFEIYQNNPDNRETISCDDISCITEGKDGLIWVATNGGGIVRVDAKTRKLKNYLFPEICKASNKVLTIWAGSDNSLWLGTDGNGIKKFDIKNESLVRFPFEKEFESCNVFGILGDEHGNLWFSTLDGLVKYNSTEKIRKVYKIGDGLQGNDFNLGSYFKGKAGRLFFGGPNGFNEFNPDSLIENEFIPPVRFTTLKVLDNDYDFSKIASDSTITLAYNQNSISFEFAALDYTSPMQNEYACIMEGLETTWQNAGNRRYANYANLSPGTYVFRVRGSNNDLVWNYKGASLKIVILPPYWATWWFRTLAIVFVFMSTYLAYRQRINVLESKHAVQLEQERIKEELHQAHEMQQNLLPQTLPQSDAFEAYAACIPTFEMGGDFYDMFWMDTAKEKLVIVTADVSGKAMKAAIMVVLTSGMLTQLRKLGFTTPSVALTQLNLAILEKKPEKRMFTATSLNFIDFKNKTMAFSNAGQPEPILFREGKTEFLESADPRLPLGQMSRVQYKHKDIDLQVNDILIFVSDAFPESVDPSGEQYGYERMFAVMRAKNEWGATELGNALLADLKAFISTAPQYDDTTIVVLKLL